jgi:hypothetical protein
MNEIFEIGILEEADRIQKELSRELFDILDFNKLTTDSYKIKTESDSRYVEYFKQTNPSHVESLIRIIDEQKDKINRYPRVVLKMGFIYGISQYEAFWSDIVRLIFKINYREFLNSNKTVTYEFLLGINDKKTIIENLIDKEVMLFGYKSIDEQFETLNTKYNLNFEEEHGENKWMEFPNAINYGKIRETFSTRNLILHNRGTINSIYLNLNSDSEYKLDEVREISESYLRDSIGLLGVTSNKIVSKIKLKYK